MPETYVVGWGINVTRNITGDYGVGLIVESCDWDGQRTFEINIMMFKWQLYIGRIVKEKIKRGW